MREAVGVMGLKCKITTWYEGPPVKSEVTPRASDPDDPNSFGGVDVEIKGGRHWTAKVARGVIEWVAENTSVVVVGLIIAGLASVIFD